MANTGQGSQHLRALVDMGSNGIRFSISDLSPATARIVPTLHQSRAGISLYDAQYSASGERIAIPEIVILAVLRALVGFKRTCQDFGVLESNVTFIATEATRTAINSMEFRQRIKDATGWEVTMLAKEEEGRVGAMGVVSSLGEVSGLMMDLGGGSTQLTWIISHGKDGLRMPKQGAVSMPFGAAALTRGLSEADRKGHGARQQFADEIKSTIKDAYNSLQVPQELHDIAQRDGGFALYLSGGGFRGWGFVLMEQHSVQPYPISVINGFKASRHDFMNTASIQATVTASGTNDEDDQTENIFRISERRASQIPAVAFLVTALSSALPQIKEVRFCQGGVREGHLFSSLLPETQSQSPLVVATTSTTTISPSSDGTDITAAASRQHFRALLAAALPATNAYASASRATNPRLLLTDSMLTALSNTLSLYATHARDVRAAAALRSTTTGFLASVHGLSHEERAILALLLCERWGGEKELPKAELGMFAALGALLDPWTRWWVGFLGRVAGLVGAVYPAGRVGGEGKLVGIQCAWGESGKGKKAATAVLELRVSLRVSKEMRALMGGAVAGVVPDVFASELAGIEKVGKKKNWVGGRDGFGHKVEVVTSFE